VPAKLIIVLDKLHTVVDKLPIGKHIRLAEQQDLWRVLVWLLEWLPEWLLEWLPEQE